MWQNIESEIKKSLSPEFINRLQILHFNYLSREHVERIFDLEWAKILQRYLEAQGIAISLTEAARQELIARGYHPEYGARHLAAILNRMGNINASKTLRRDQAPHDHEKNANSILRVLRQMRDGAEEIDLRRARRMVRDYARLHVPYKTLVIDLQDGDFSCEPR